MAGSDIPPRPPEGWQLEARAFVHDWWEEVTRITTYIRMVREALEADDYNAYVEASIWLSANQSDP